jgi:cellulose biosynthesis protein BcsQ
MDIREGGLMKIVAPYNNKGGVGKTTLAAHLAWLAATRGVRVLAVALDRQGDILRMLTGGAVDETVAEGLVTIADNLDGLYSPDVFPDVGEFAPYDLVVVDGSPSIDMAVQIPADLFLVPVDGRMALDNLMNVLEDLTRQASTLVVFNKANVAGKRMFDRLQRAAALVPNVEVHATPIPLTSAIARTGEMYRPLWEVPNGMDVRGSQEFLEVCWTALRRLDCAGQTRKSGRGRR